jgi:hypothetical protein
VVRRRKRQALCHDSERLREVQADQKQLRDASRTVHHPREDYGPDAPATTRILPEADWDHARRTVRRKYWMARIPFVWSKNNVYLEITFP